MRFTQILALLLLSGLASCSSLRRQHGVHLSSDPPGATVLVNGRDTGFVTPCTLKLKNKKSQVEFVRDGYATASRKLVRGKRRKVLHWNEMSVFYNTWNFPLWLNFEDILNPVMTERGPTPGRVFVRLQRSADQ